MKAITLIPPRAFGSALRFLCLVLLFLAVGACSTTVTRPDDADATRPVVKALQSVTLEMSPTAKSQLADSIKFDQGELYDVLERTLEVFEIAKTAAEKGNPNSMSDAGVASLCALAAAEGAYYNVLINLKEITDEAYAAEMRAKAARALEETGKLAGEVREATLAGIA